MSKIQLARWLFRVMRLDNYFYLVSKEVIERMIVQSSRLLPQSKILTLTLMRIDGSDFKTASKKYFDLTGEEVMKVSENV